MHIDPDAPIADGILFDDLHDKPIEICNFLAAREVVFLTAFHANGREYGGSIISPSMPSARQIAFGRGLGEKVIGTLIKTKPAAKAVTKRKVWPWL